MFDKFAKSWRLIKLSAKVLSADKELIIFPVFSFIACMLILASFVGGFLGLNYYSLEQGNFSEATFYVWLFIWYVVNYFILFFFNSALVGAALIRLDGGDPTVKDGLNIAFKNIRKIFTYALIAATVGIILRYIEDRVEFLGKIIISIIGAAWTLATALVIPILVNENRGPIDAIKDSAHLLKKTWGEDIVGGIAIGFIFNIIILVVVLVGALATFSIIGLGNNTLTVVVIAFFTVLVLIAVFANAALEGIYAAALYRYADEGSVGVGFDDAVMKEAFSPKK